MNLGFIKIAREGLSFLLIILFMILLVGFMSWKWAAIPLVAFIFVVFFFRDPERTIPGEPGIVVSSADGTVDGIDEVLAPDNSGRKVKRVSIFLSIFNVHINRIPYGGVVETVTYRPGKFHNAMEGKSSIFNEHNLVQLKCDTRTIWVKQIAGMIARRIICYCHSGDPVIRGERFGLIRFGSRVEIFLPPDTEILVKMKDKVKGGETVIGKLAS